MSVARLKVHQAKTNLSKYVVKLKAGDRIVLCRRNREMAEIRPIVEPNDKPRSIGLGKGLAVIPDSFFEPLPDEFLDRFESKLRGRDARRRASYWIPLPSIGWWKGTPS